MVDIPDGLAADGWTLQLMVEIYGKQLSEDLDDPPWIEEATAAGWAILTKDFKSLRYRLPFQTVKEVGARVFALANAQLDGPVALEWFRTNKNRIWRAARKPGPYIYKVYETTIERVWP